MPSAAQEDVLGPVFSIEKIAGNASEFLRFSSRFCKAAAWVWSLLFFPLRSDGVWE